MTVPRQRATTTPSVRPRSPDADNLKVCLVVGVIVAHVTMAWTGLGTWVFDEPPVGEPMLSVATLLAVIGSLFGMALFFLIAGVFTPRSLARKGLGRFLADRAIRLGAPMVFFAVVLSPIVEYVDPENAGWAKGFGAFAVHTWWPPVPGPTWFLGVLLLLSVVYAVTRTLLPARTSHPTPLRARYLVTAGAVVALASYALRFAIPLGQERWHMALGQAPAWVVGFTLGALAGERGWFDPIEATMARNGRHVAWGALAGCVVVIGLASALGANIDDFGGGGTWQSLVVAALEATLVVTVPLWLLDLFRRRFNHQGPLAREMSRAAFAAFIVHQVVLVGLVLASHHVPWAPEPKYVTVSVLGVLGSFAIGSLLVRLPGVSRVI
ncbi:acyltransferase [Pedococcus sp. KACC 23699]|uniref:Acyltransferase n=1 Tax=Pedococcus sp. KACC 23699 TaxID=3149228 RepID=A0AAU7JSD0_9MICO